MFVPKPDSHNQDKNWENEGQTPRFLQLTGKGRREKLEKRSDADFSGRGKKGSMRETQ